jgi:hypothetical protein
MIHVHWQQAERHFQLPRNLKLIQIIFKNLVTTSQKTLCILLQRPIGRMLFREIIAVYSENRLKSKNICVAKMQSNHSALKIKIQYVTLLSNTFEIVWSERPLMVKVVMKCMLKVLVKSFILIETS